MQRKGSAFQGLGVVTLKELSDHLSGWRMFVLEWLIAITAVVSVYGAIQQIRDSTAEDPFLLLRLFTRGTPLPFVAWLFCRFQLPIQVHRQSSFARLSWLRCR